MKIKGFTLIELLAVIVILAIIALIATPIVLNIIQDTRTEATKRSVENYMKAVEQAVVRKNLTGEYNPSICTVTNGNLTCPEGNLTVEVEGEKPSDGTIVFGNGKIKSYSGIKIGNSYARRDEDKNMVISSTNDSSTPVASTICKAVTQATTGNVPEGNYKPGDEYTCEVAEGINYKFFVISSNTANVNLIMYANINNDGLSVENDTSNKGITAYNKSGDAKIGGPVDAVEYLNQATISWSNLTDLTGIYNDEGGNFTDFAITGKARLPYLSEVSNYDSTNKTNLYLYDYVVSSAGVPKNSVSGIAGYWLFSSNAGDSTFARFVNFNGNLGKFGVSSSNLGPGSLGVRPVITLLKSQLG